MRKFYAVFTNDRGFRVTINFQSSGWAGIQSEARKAFNRIEEHKKYGPWTLGAVDVAA